MLHVASIALFSAVFGYSANEYVQRHRSEKIGHTPTWKDVGYGSRSDVDAAIQELRRVLPRDGAVDTVRRLMLGT